MIEGRVMEEKKVYICPTCGKECGSEDEVSKHFLKCWKENNPHHKSKPAPRSEDKDIREITPELEDFFAKLKVGE